MPASDPNSILQSAERELIITRVFDAPHDLVWKAWTEPARLAQWFGPQGFTLPVCDVDLRAGGVFHFVMRGPDGRDYPANNVFLDVTAPHWLAFRGSIDAVPGHTIVTLVTFAPCANQTKITMHQAFSFESDSTRGALIGWSQTLDRLAQHLR